MVMKSFVRALTSLLLCLLASCKLDYSMVRVAPLEGALHITRVTPEHFQISMCRAQRQVHQAMKSINPQKTPACDALSAQSRQG